MFAGPKFKGERRVQGMLRLGAHTTRMEDMGVDLVMSALAALKRHQTETAHIAIPFWKIPKWGPFGPK